MPAAAFPLLAFFFKGFAARVPVFIFPPLPVFPPLFRLSVDPYFLLNLPALLAVDDFVVLRVDGDDFFLALVEEEDVDLEAFFVGCVRDARDLPFPKEDRVLVAAAIVTSEWGVEAFRRLIP